MIPYYHHEVDTPFSPPTFLDANYGITFSYEPLPLDPPPPPAPTDAHRRRKRNDRHSKIRTAQGLRDRRMRLSVDVASRFFALQDTLRFDKASATVDWLLEQSQPSVERVYGKKAAEEVRPSPSASRRESRAEARARARSRTMKKKKRMMLVASLANGSNVDPNLPVVPGGEFMNIDYDDTVNFFQEEFDL